MVRRARSQKGVIFDGIGRPGGCFLIGTRYNHPERELTDASAIAIRIHRLRLHYSSTHRIHEARTLHPYHKAYPLYTDSLKMATVHIDASEDTPNVEKSVTTEDDGTIVANVSAGSRPGRPGRLPADTLATMVPSSSVVTDFSTLGVSSLASMWTVAILRLSV